jgi:hypothetical protein
MNIKNISYLCSIVIFVSGLSAFGVVYSESDLLDGAGNFEFSGGSGPWTLWADGGESSTISGNLAYSGIYAWKAGPAVASGTNIRTWTPINTFGKRSHKIVASTCYQGSAPTWVRMRLGSDAWDPNMNITSGSLNVFSSSILYQSTDVSETSPNLALAVYTNSAGDTLYVDKVAVYRERCVPEANKIDSLGGVLPYGEKVTVIIDTNQGTNASGYTKNFDPDIKVTSPYAIIHSYNRLSDTQIQVELEAIYGGNIILTLRNESSNLESTHTMTSKYPLGTFLLDSNEFPIIMFDAAAMGDGTEAELMRTCGMTYVQRFSQCDSGSGIDADITELKTYMERAEKYGMRVMVNLKAHEWIVDGNYVGVDAIQTIATAVKDCNAFGFWYLIDEPEVRDRQTGTLGRFGASAVLPYYTMLKTLTPNVPVAITHAQKEYSSTYADWYDYDSCEDIFMSDRYEINDEDFPNADVASATNFIRSAKSIKASQGSSDKIIPSLQCHNRLHFGVGTWEDITADCRYPNAIEVRYFCYAPVIQGCRGLSWYSYGASVYPNGSDGGKDQTWLKNTFRPVGQEIRKFSYLAAPLHEPEVILDGGTGTNDLYMAVWPRSTGYWVALVNGNSEARTVTINTSSKIANAILKPWGMTRDANAQVINGQLKIRIQPWETFVWTAQKDADLNSDGNIDFLDLNEMMINWLEMSYPLSN